ncbi:MAG: hypothetical protein IPL24_11660 [Bacteroidetes bacterium]|nr:hypothetical protein [Bacteroidota bacterium]
MHFLNEAFKHCKAIAVDRDATEILDNTYFAKKLPDPGVITGTKSEASAKDFISAIAQHRFWEREKARKVPA